MTNRYNELLQKQKAFLHAQNSRSADSRKTALRRLYLSIRKHEQQIIRALQQDLHKSELEAYSSEVGIVLSEISYALKHLSGWMQPEKVRTPITHWGAKSYTLPEPYGVVLIISPWNFPFQLALSPLVGAIAAGNTAIIKPSELTPRTSAIIAAVAADAFDSDYVAVVEGDADASRQLLELQTDYIFFTGGNAVGKIVMEAASRWLTPVTLELGGKSPCIVHHDASVKTAAKRIAWGKFMNAGQTCVAPDYLYVHEQILEVFLAELKLAITELYGKDPLHNVNYTHIVNERHFDRLVRMQDGGNLIFGGQYDRSRLCIAPTLLLTEDWNHPIMQEEIFGPILPIVAYRDLDEIMNNMKAQAKPLALYIFSEDRSVQNKLTETLSFGGGCINDTVYHFTNPYLPFGGVGASGMGAYHGKHSFELFSHRKSILKQTTAFDLPFRYPSMKNGLSWIKRFLK